MPNDEQPCHSRLSVALSTAHHTSKAVLGGADGQQEHHHGTDRRPARRAPGGIRVEPRGPQDRRRQAGRHREAPA